MSDERGPRITCQTAAQINARHHGCLMWNYKHCAHHRFKLSWYVKPSVAALDEGGASGGTAPRWGRRGQCASTPGYTQAARFPWVRWVWGCAKGTAIFSVHSFLLKVLWLSNVTALTSEAVQLKLPPAALLDLSLRQLIGVKDTNTCILWCAFFFTSSLCIHTEPPTWKVATVELAVFIGCVLSKVQNKTDNGAAYSSVHREANAYD